MRGRFTRPVRIGGKLFECGEHEIDAALANHWYLKALVTDGLVQIIDDPKPEPKPVPQTEAPKVAPTVKPAAQPAPAKPAQHPKPVKRAGKK